MIFWLLHVLWCVYRLIVASQCRAKFEIHSSKSSREIKFVKKVVALQSYVFCDLPGLNVLKQVGLTLEIQRGSFFSRYLHLMGYLFIHLFIYLFIYLLSICAPSGYQSALKCRKCPLL